MSDETYYRLLKQYWGYTSFRPQQLETIRAVCGGNDVLLLMPTGGGKSIVYQIPGLARGGICIVITPLIALMKDQIDQLRKRNISAVSIHGGMPFREIDRLLDNCVYGDVKFLFIAPERIDSELFRSRYARMNVSLLAVDEAHCISQWGYDFRPAYLKIARLREAHPEVPVLALTASATSHVSEDIMTRLKFRHPCLLRTSFARDNLVYVVRKTEDKSAQLVRILQNVSGSAIVYVRTRDRAESIADFLRQQGFSADFYHGGMNYFTRSERQDAWITDRLRVMVATNAFGMGIDKRDVRLVIHYDLCDSLENYYQESGRAGRDGEKAYAVLLFSEGDIPRASQRLRLDYPPLKTIRQIYESIFNYLNIAIGDGKGSAYTFNIYEFAARFRFFVPTVVHAIKILQQNGYMTLTDEQDNPSRIRFIVTRDALYRIRVDRKELDHLLTVLLRRYTGLFSDFVPIDEDELVHLSGYTAERLKELLKMLWQLHIIRYIPGKRSPVLILDEERLPTRDVRISPESYAQRKACATQRLDQMLHYATTDECRSLMIRRYFGETVDQPCGVCDVCLKNRRRATGPHDLEQEILTRLGSEPMSIRELTSTLRRDPNLILETVTDLLHHGKIKEREDGKLQINM